MVKISDNLFGFAPSPYQEVPDLENPPKPPVVEAMSMVGLFENPAPSGNLT
jgi:hypothetical protein